jgi:3-hexulose-6-phosphate synthase/6-phospho-3-hexuloisomerase
MWPGAKTAKEHSDQFGSVEPHESEDRLYVIFLRESLGGTISRKILACRTDVDDFCGGILIRARLRSTAGALIMPRMKPIVQISLDVINLEEAIDTAHRAVRAGVDWLEAGTPLILAEGLRSVRALRAEFPDVPIVADLKTMDGGYLEAEMMAKAGASYVVVMAQAHDETIRCVVKAGADFGIGVMGDNMVSADMVAAAKRLEDLGCGYVIHHIGYDQRRGIAARGQRPPNPLDQLREVVAAVNVPVQAVGGLTLEQAIKTPDYGAPLVVLGAPLVIDSERFKTADGNVEQSLRRICDAVHAAGDVPVGHKA